MPKQYCKILRCSNYAVTNRHMCSEHIDRRRQLSAHARGYGARWRKMRADFLENNPFCARCDNYAYHVDHIVPKSNGGRDTPQNLQALCASCHGKKTTLEDGASQNLRRQS